MSNAVSSGVSPGKLTQEEREVIRRLVESSTFASAPRLRSVLVFLSQMLEANRAEELTEQSIGQKVFGKPAGYNYSEDNIVRVTVRHLRTRLEEYYQNEGITETQVFSIPKGKYIPVFFARELPVSGAAPAAAKPIKLEVPQVEGSGFFDTPFVAPFPKLHIERMSHRVLLVLMASTILGALSGYAVWSWMNSSNDARMGLLALFCRRGSTATVVVVDSNLQVYRSVFGKQVSLEDYINRRYGREPLSSSDPRVESALRFALDSAETNVSSAIVAASLKHSLPGRQVVIKQPHEISMREFQGPGDVILLGGPWINPWGQLFESRLNFRMLPLPSEPSSSHIRNYSPESGEAMDYSPHMDGNLDVNYLRIAILPNFDQKGKVFIVGATSTEALEAGGDFLTNPDNSKELLEKFDVKHVSELPPLEIVLEVKGLNGVPGSRRIMAIRRIS